MASSPATPAWFTVSIGPLIPNAILVVPAMAFITVLGNNSGLNPSGPLRRNPRLKRLGGAQVTKLGADHETGYG